MVRIERLPQTLCLVGCGCLVCVCFLRTQQCVMYIFDAIWLCMAVLAVLVVGVVGVVVRGCLFVLVYMSAAPFLGWWV